LLEKAFQKAKESAKTGMTMRIETPLFFKWTSSSAFRFRHCFRRVGTFSYSHVSSVCADSSYKVYLSRRMCQVRFQPLWWALANVMWICEWPATVILVLGGDRRSIGRRCFLMSQATSSGRTSTSANCRLSTLPAFVWSLDEEICLKWYQFNFYDNHWAKSFMLIFRQILHYIVHFDVIRNHSFGRIAFIYLKWMIHGCHYWDTNDRHDPFNGSIRFVITRTNEIHLIDLKWVMK
jgi:hypothetical protein